MLKRECFNRCRIETLADLRQLVAVCADWFNNVRISRYKKA
ncbi:IS3 family transposase [Lacticaseibacillus paracasei]